MNKELYQSYTNLSEIAKTDLRNKYKASPIGLRLIDFLEKVKKPDFKTTEAVAYIYKKDKDEKYSVLENRYFKLRKKIYDNLNGEQVAPLSALPEEEAVLNRCKQMIANGEKKEAYKLLAGLEKVCWKKNIFELLPAVLDTMIFCNQGFNQIEKNTSLYKKQEEAITLQYDLNMAIMYTRQMYEVFFAKGTNWDKELSEALKVLGDKHKAYPRFIMLYHYASVSYKLTSMDYADNMQVISRHLTEFKKLYEQNPGVPIVIYKTGYDKLFHFHYNQITALYHTNKAEFEEAYMAVYEMWNMVNSGDPFFLMYKTDSLYFNMFAMQCVTGRYRDALETCNAFSVFVKDTGRLDTMPMINSLKGLLYVMAYPQTFKLDVAYLLDQAEEYIRTLKKKGDNVHFPLAQAMLVKTELFIIQADYKNAAKLLNDVQVMQYLKASNTLNHFMELLTSLKNGSKQGLHEWEKRVAQQKYKATKIDEILALNWLISFVKRNT
jgi:hypothetical protein